ncbi:hypothetical protein PHYBLDRAFT_171282 [Phycomyces blakesleeanus NRRL 1555(-)]|uniref:Uncharacterized protein n=1 Tax=Phycomyces blakesleeanus (strain ATCC 8743b / DSM 1359 / FGSC 10004 / NBRC 33097 / NRRL 1555) TaxID=763407 RepID=A0A167J4G2_PHYB8|nr:hypothetical protein PHYBLDRAFT_176414 [Phycomyces blakesleeanus NRRL 1555(-)]XP_018288573.1 hypothetical protein PHYBLDRAFT_171282 [Phycomyces blakesleeanus NRRL 1555(-)]OAD65119.1 hypothetical protein PHYBLDRAFT_176414 [Phycomyces blakesleeanus NRRL 1555(-)]OAD70533.1 hypothetical protein PHYBLDRAFT_171282 [Phycomyces blakesleeanus NRRL 1555(-)]|eukprot:XP_018283159.1 hypothetical protein PHYBLDRAFT_176414 [Phycomyces blakesleeanus NRRL 1555(-)]
MICISTIDDIVPLLKMIYHKNCDDIGSIIYIFGTFDPDEITLFFQWHLLSSPTMSLPAHIHNLMWKPKLSLRTPENILANNLKPRWDTNVAFNKSPNREIAERLLSNLERRFGSSSMRWSDLQKRLHTNFTSRTRRERMSDDEIAETNALTRRAARADDNECRRVLAYKDNKKAIDLVMLRDCANTLQKAVMSDGESADEMDEDGIKHVIHIVQPGWRSDECNRFIALVDTYAVQAMGSSANQRIRRITTSVSNSAVPDNISPNFPRWALRDGL